MLLRLRSDQAGRVARYAARGNFWWRSAMLAYLVRLNHYTQVRLGLESLKTQIGYQHPIIGVHVRHGDACHTTTRKGTCKGLASYLPRIRVRLRLPHLSEATPPPRRLVPTASVHPCTSARRLKIALLADPWGDACAGDGGEVQYHARVPGDGRPAGGGRRATQYGVHVCGGTSRPRRAQLQRADRIP